MLRTKTEKAEVKRRKIPKNWRAIQEKAWDALRGKPSWNKGKKHSEKHIKNLKKNHKGMVGKKHTEETKIKMGESHKGHFVSEKTKRKMSEKAKGKCRSPKTEFKKGHKESDEIRIKRLRKNPMKGKTHWCWKGGITPINEKIRRSAEYKLWRKAVFERDKWTCIWCGKVGGRLHADHIKPFALYPELRFAIDNGRTLCKNCHIKTDTYGGKSHTKRKK